MTQSVWTRLAGVPTAFGLSGLIWVVARFVLFGFNSSLMAGLAVAFVALAVLALATLPNRRTATLGGLWVLAVAVNTLWISVSDLGGGFLANLYAGGLIGTLLFTLWVALGVVVLLHLPERRDDNQDSRPLRASLPNM